MGVVYRALDRLTGQEVALKRIALEQRAVRPVQSSRAMAAAVTPTLAVMPPDPLAMTVAPASDGAWDDTALPVGAKSDENSPQDSQRLADLRLALAQEFRTLASLRHPHVISVFDYGFDAARQPYYTMELLFGAKTLAEAAGHLDLDAKVAILLQVLQALVYLHRRGILHRDIKPQNALAVTTAGGLQVKLVDFGLSIQRDQIAHTSASIAGTLAYIAPELLQGALPSEAAELYAFGVMAYELLLGRCPFPQQNLGDLIAAVLNQEPEIPSGVLAPPIAGVMRRLLQKDPAARLGKAEAAIMAWSTAIGHPPPPETAAVRESFLHSARFVGRDQEMGELRTALVAAVASRGSAWLVGGEGGVGKSRLLDELRAEALVQGALVLRGSAVSSGGSPYRVWRDILLPLCLVVRITPFQASVLKSLIPTLPTLLGHDIVDAPTLDAQTANLRLLGAIEDLLFGAASPLVLLLEDLHWAEPESLELLNRVVAAGLERHRLLLVASYRDEETPQLAGQLQKMHHRKLARLRTASIAALSEAMLGEIGRRGDLIELLQKETEGNAYFVVEVVRALAEEFGRLSALGQAALPDRIASGGIKAVLDRRLGRIASADQLLLRLAAVAGRQLDLRVLQTFSIELDTWLHSCADAAILEISEDKWQFVHSKLRERLIEMLSPAERRRLHGEVAAAIARAYAGDPTHSAELAYHYRQADQPRQTMLHAAIAGEQALKQGALQAAVTLLGEASQLQERFNVPLLERTRVRYGLGHALQGLGRQAESVPMLEMALAQWGLHVPQSGVELGGRLAGGLGKLLGRHLLASSLPQQGPRPTQTALEESFATLMALGECYLLRRQFARNMLLTIEWVNYAETSQMKEITAYYYSGMAVAFLFTPFTQMASFYRRKAEFIFAKADKWKGDNGAPPWVEYYCLLIGFSYVAEDSWDAWADSRRMLTRALDMARANAHEEMQVRTTVTLLQVWLATGEFQTIVDISARLYQLAERAFPSYCIYSQAALAHVQIRRGNLAQAELLLQDAKRFCTAGSDVSMHVSIMSAEALWAAKRDHEQAHRIATQCLALVAKAPLNPFTMEDTGSLAEALFELWWRARGTAAEVLRRQLARITDRLTTFGQRFAVARSKAALWQGLRDWMAGRSSSAYQRLLAAAQWGAKMGEPYDQGLAELWLGRLSAGGFLGPAANAHSEEHLQHARELLTQPKLGVNFSYTPLRK